MSTTAQATEQAPNRHGGARFEYESHGAAMPPLPVIDWSSIGASAPKAITDSSWDPDTNTIAVDMVIMTWTSAEWAAFDHVFCNSNTPMPQEYYEDDSWRNDWKYYHNGWDTIKADLPSKAPSLKNSAWGSCRIVEFTANGKKALLLKSDMHISTDGPKLPLRNMVEQLIKDFSPKLVLTIGTAGGCKNSTNLGSVQVTSAARFDLSGEFESQNFPFNHKTETSSWKPGESWLEKVRDSKLLMETPVKDAELQALRDKNEWKLKNPDTGEAYTLDELRNKEIQPGAIPPVINWMADTPVLTTNGYVVGNTSGNYDDFSAMEMDDAVIGLICNEHSTTWGVVRNISDPVQNADINENVQGQWGGIIYSEYGLYTSYNGALAAWACASAE